MPKENIDTKELRSTLSELKSQMQGIEKNISESDMKEKIESAKQTAMEKKKEMETKVQEHPLSSMGMAFGIGMLAGALTSTLLNKRGNT